MIANQVVVIVIKGYIKGGSIPTSAIHAKIEDKPTRSHHKHHISMHFLILQGIINPSQYIFSPNQGVELICNTLPWVLGNFFIITRMQYNLKSASFIRGKYN